MPQIQLFSVYEVDAELEDPIPAFFVESTAPDNLDDKDGAPATPRYCKPSNVDEIVKRLARQQNPKLLISVHGFNTPRDKALETFQNSFEAVNQDSAIRGSGVVCLGYRWPSEKMLSPWPSGFSAAPWFLLGVLAASLAIFCLVNFSSYFDICGLWKPARIALTAVTAMMAIVPITLFLLRLIVYFRDGFRATTFGVPDLVDLVRQIDAKLSAELNIDSSMNDLGRRVDLSFIGHSMGGFVVTNAVRVLTDVFSPEALDAMNYGAKELGSENERQERERRSKIGKSFLLRRLVLVSPDITAEVLLSGRSNPLQSSLIRFQEAHLFSNEGDEVLRSISTTANFFSLPTKKRKFGCRLGNVGVLTDWGISENLTLGRLRVGWHTLYELYAELDAAQTKDSLAQRLTYFDCTGSIDDEGRGVVTDATRGAPPNLSWLGHLRLLWVYATGKADVHSGYFLKPSLVRELIYRFASIGYGDSERAYGGLAALSELCKKQQIKALKLGEGAAAAPVQDEAQAASAQ